jgi:hypothetical protein
MENPLPQLLNLQPSQVSIIADGITQLTSLLADFRFNDPATDELTIRQHAAISGQRDALSALLTYDSRIVSTQQENILPSNPTDSQGE